jgi:hypothetical protein
LIISGDKPIEECRAASKSPHSFYVPATVSADSIPNLTAAIFSPKKEGTNTKAARVPLIS